MLETASDGECRGSGERIRWYCHFLRVVSEKLWSWEAIGIPEYTNTFSFLVAMMVTSTLGAGDVPILHRECLRVTCSRDEQQPQTPDTSPKLFQNVEGHQVAGRRCTDDG